MAAGDERGFVAWTKSSQNLASVLGHNSKPFKRIRKKEIGEKDVFVNETTHTVKLKIAEREGRGNVEGAECSCKAG